jgi:hypothetical protein
MRFARLRGKNARMKAQPKKREIGAAKPAAVVSGPEDAYLLTKDQLATRMATTPRHIELMVYARKIPVIRLGHKTIRFSWPRVEAALAKLEEHAVA